MNSYTVQVASQEHFVLAESICHEMAESAKARGTGIAKRSPEYLREKMSEGKAIIATDDVDGSFVGFCYIETWQHGTPDAALTLLRSRRLRRLIRCSMPPHHP